MERNRRGRKHLSKNNSNSGNNENRNRNDRNIDRNIDRKKNRHDNHHESRHDSHTRDSAEMLLNKSSKKHFHPTRSVTPEQIKNDEEAIKAFKSSNQIICPKCQKVIVDMASAMNDKASGQLMHFDCALETVQAQEKLSPGEKIVYIGQGRFGVLYFENIHDAKHFQIRRIIETEDRENRAEYRNQMADLFSQVK